MAIGAAAALLVAPGNAGAQGEVVIDNDLFGIRGADAAPPDHDYTHGTVVSWDGRTGRGSVGQRIYTPRRDGAEPVPGERPYAGWLFGAWERTRASDRGRSRLRVEAGVTGPPSLAETVQNGLHRLAGYRPQRGWDHQLGFEPGVVVTLAHERRAVDARWRAARLEVIPSAAVRAGNVRTGAEAGVRARLGLRAGDALAGAGTARGWSGWVEVAGTQEGVLRDLFLDGSTFGRRPTGVERRPWITQGDAAVAVQYGRAEVEYRFVLRGREYGAQVEPHRYGSVRLRLHR